MYCSQFQVINTTPNAMWHSFITAQIEVGHSLHYDLATCTHNIDLNRFMKIHLYSAK